MPAKQRGCFEQCVTMQPFSTACKFSFREWAPGIPEDLDKNTESTRCFNRGSLTQGASSVGAGILTQRQPGGVTEEATVAASVGVKKQGEGLQNQIQTPKEGAAPMGGGAWGGRFWQRWGQVRRQNLLPKTKHLYWVKNSCWGDPSRKGGEQGEPVWSPSHASLWCIGRNERQRAGKGETSFL